MSGASTGIWRSKRPGRSSAGSSTSGRLVAAMRIDAAVDVEAVHLDQQLVERLLALVVAAAHAGAAVAADGVDLVDEDDAGAFSLACSNRSRTRLAPTPTNISTKSEPGDREERDARLAGDRARQQRLAGAGRAVQQHALGDLGADGLELAGLGEELADLLELLDGLLAPATSANVVCGVSLLASLALLLPKEMICDVGTCW
jgi:hypothetical protein